MAQFSIAYEWMMDNEDAARKYAKVPDAPPGAFAIAGINSAAHPQEFAAIDGMTGDARTAAIQAFYEANYWNQFLEKIASDEVCKRVFDAGVNMGTFTGCKLLQQALNEDGVEHIVEDGAWGPNTLAATNAADEATLITNFKVVRSRYYRNIVMRDPSKAKYLPVWLARAQK